MNFRKFIKFVTLKIILLYEKWNWRNSTFSKLFYSEAHIFFYVGSIRKHSPDKTQRNQSQNFFSSFPKRYLWQNVCFWIVFQKKDFMNKCSLRLALQGAKSIKESNQKKLIMLMDSVMGWVVIGQYGVLSKCKQQRWQALIQAPESGQTSEMTNCKSMLHNNSVQTVQSSPSRTPQKREIIVPRPSFRSKIRAKTKKSWIFGCLWSGPCFSAQVTMICWVPGFFPFAVDFHTFHVEFFVVVHSFEFGNGQICIFVALFACLKSVNCNLCFQGKIQNLNRPSIQMSTDFFVFRSTQNKTFCLFFWVFQWSLQTNFALDSKAVLFLLLQTSWPYENILPGPVYDWRCDDHAWPTIGGRGGGVKKRV